jgi:hypothetical protein
MEPAVEQLRKIWTPGRELEEINEDLSPRTELDSQIRHLLHAIVQQQGRPIQVSLDITNKGFLRWERTTVTGAGGIKTGELVTIWVEDHE